MKISVIITVLNEEKTIERLLDSLAKQTKKPDEIIVVDGGSTDSTVAKIRKYYVPHTIYHILEKPGFSIAAGRNFGVKKARYSLIAMTDAGCVAHQDWLEELTQSFTLARPGLLRSKGQALINIPDIAAGFYRMTGETVFQRCLACYLGVLPEKLEPKKFLPSTRSIAFRKEIWEKIGGFDEKLKGAGEDTLFDYQAKRLEAKFVTVPKALVDWEMPKTWKEACKKFYTYAKGDAQTNIWWDPDKRLATHNLKILTIFSRYLVGFLLLFLLHATWDTEHAQIFMFHVSCFMLLCYALWSILKNYRYVQSWQAIFILPVLQIVSDIAVMAGFLSGIMKI